jgi:hypothetical protein
MTDPSAEATKVSDKINLLYFRPSDGKLVLRDDAHRDIAFALDAAVTGMRRRKDEAYNERNQVVAALAKLFPSGIARTSIEGWDAEWHGCVYIDLPTGQVSWHYHDSHSHLFDDLPPYAGAWDGHDTPEKYRRLAALTSRQPLSAPDAKRLAEMAKVLWEAREDIEAISGFPRCPFEPDDAEILAMARAAISLIDTQDARAAVVEECAYERDGDVEPADLHKTCPVGDLIRYVAMEECAQIADGWDFGAPIAKDIRALLRPADTEGEG